MKRKRLSREGGAHSWGFDRSTYYQFRMDCDGFHGLVGVIYLKDMASQSWNFKIAGNCAVCGDGMVWFELVPDGKQRVITAMLNPEPKEVGGIRYLYAISAWYIDIIDALEFDEDGVAAFLDKYLDVILTPQGDVCIDDRDELDAAHVDGELSDEQYQAALREGDDILAELASDLPKTEECHMKLFARAEEIIRTGVRPMPKRREPQQ